MKRNGFSLFELVVYLAIFSLFSFLSFNFLSEVYKKFFDQMKENKLLIRRNIIFDLLKRDMLCAISKISYWDEKDFVFRQVDIKGKIRDISWQMRTDGVYRLMGIYDFAKKIWLKKNVAKLDFSCYEISFLFQKDKSNRFIESIQVLLGDNIEFTTALRNKIRL